MCAECYHTLAMVAGELAEEGRLLREQLVEANAAGNNLLAENARLREALAARPPIDRWPPGEAYDEPSK
jgi:hypothetical protein